MQSELNLAYLEFRIDVMAHFVLHPCDLRGGPPPYNSLWLNQLIFNFPQLAWKSNSWKSLSNQLIKIQRKISSRSARDCAPNSDFSKYPSKSIFSVGAAECPHRQKNSYIYNSICIYTYLFKTYFFEQISKSHFKQLYFAHFINFMRTVHCSDLS